MRRLHVFASVVTAFIAVACATTSDEDDTDVLTEPTVSGLEVDASVTEIVTQSNPPAAFPKIQFNVKVTLTNTTGSTATLLYRPGCTVRIQLRTPDDSKLYDETTRDCAPGIASITVPPQSQETLFSGIRFPATVLGDSITPGRYRVIAVLEKDDAPVHIEAGLYNIPFCDSNGCRPVVAARGAER